MDIEQMRILLFEVFSAGFEAGYASNKDIKTAFEDWFNVTVLPLLQSPSPYVS